MRRGTAIWVYGSSARGDTDELSDFDVLVVGRMTSSLVEVFRSGTFGTQAPSFSNYSWREIQEMTRYGSLFLHHLRLEGRPLLEDDPCKGHLRAMLQDLRPYMRAAKDLLAFRVVLDDVQRSLSIGDLVEFELSVLATVIRHASILGCSLLGVPCFGRTGPVERFSRGAIREGWHMDGFAELYAYRLYFDKRIGGRDLARVCPCLWLRRARRLLWALGEVVDGRISHMHQGH